MNLIKMIYFIPWKAVFPKFGLIIINFEFITPEFISFIINIFYLNP